MGPPNSVSNCWAIGLAGMRTATVSRPAVTRSDRPQSARVGRTKVSGPGQKAAARARASGGISAIFSTAAMFATCTINGLNCGRDLAVKMPATARSLRASAPRP